MYRNSEIKDRNIDELLGLCRGIIADGETNQREAEFLRNWIENNFSRRDLMVYPLKTLYWRLMGMLQDGILDDEESRELFEILERYTGECSIIKEARQFTSTLPLDLPMPEVKIKGSQFVFTGAFTIGTRKACETLIKDLGGEYKKAPTLKTDYLVIGLLGSEDWIHSSYGRKIEKAVELRDERKTGISIISEEHFIRFLED